MPSGRRCPPPPRPKAKYPAPMTAKDSKTRPKIPPADRPPEEESDGAADLGPLTGDLSCWSMNGTGVGYSKGSAPEGRGVLTGAALGVTLLGPEATGAGETEGAEYAGWWDESCGGRTDGAAEWVGPVFIGATEGACDRLGTSSAMGAVATVGAAAEGTGLFVRAGRIVLGARATRGAFVIAVTTVSEKLGAGVAFRSSRSTHPRPCHPAWHSHENAS